MKNMRTLFMVVFLLVILSSCTKQKDNSTNNDPQNGDYTITAEQQKQISESINSFGVDMLKIIDNSDTDNENVFFSPFSINSALYMVMNGAEGETKTQLLSALKLKDLNIPSINANHKAIYDILTNSNKSENLFLANSIWINNNFTVENTFQKTLENYYYAQAFNKDFANSATLTAINDWIANNTGGMIKNMLDRIDKLAVLYLINAIYFKDNWKIQFDKEKTTKTTFTNSDNSTSTVDMMFIKDTTLRKYSDDKLKAVELPYNKSNTRMLIIQPKSFKDLNTYIGNLNYSDISNLSEKMKASELTLLMPKFKLETKYLLNDILKKLSISKAFTPDAEFDLITKAEKIFISRVLHNAAIEVDEAGTKAAAATVVEFERTSIDESSIINLNSPFMFFIIDNKTNAILFVGKINKL